jgi:hypothetical protein
MKDIHAIRFRCVEVLSVIAVLAFPLVIEAAELENPDGQLHWPSPKPRFATR